MPEKERISLYQLFCMVVTFIFGTSSILMSLTIAGRNTWISMILAIIPAAVMVLVITGLAEKYPGMTLIEYAQALLGKIPGKIVGALYLWYFLHLGALVLRNYGEFLTTEVMPETPLWFFQATLAAVVGFFVYHRIEVMARLSEIVLVIAIFVSFMVSFLITNSNIIEVKNLLPVMEHGVGKVLLGSVPITAFPFLEVVLFAMFFPHVKSAAKCRKVTLGAIGLSGLILTMIMVQLIAVFGEYMSSLTYPRFYMVKMISVGGFIERIEPVVLAVWIMSGLIKMGICLYAFVLGLAQLLGLKDYRFLIGPAMITTAVLSVNVYENTYEMINFANNIYPIYAFPFEVALPVLMLVVALFKKRGGKAAQGGRSGQ